MFGKKKDGKKYNGFLFTSMSHDDWVFSSLLSEQRENTTLRTEIKTLEKEVEEAKKQSALTKKKNASLEKRVASYAKELERMFLQAIGEAETVKQVNAVVGRYNKSSLCAEQVDSILQNIFCVNLSADNATKLNGTSIHQAAATKIKRLNRQNILDMCDYLDTEKDKASYARHMMAVLKDVTGKEVDGTRIIEAKKAGLDAMSVFKSVLASYNVKQDEVM